MKRIHNDSNTVCPQLFIVVIDVSIVGFLFVAVLVGGGLVVGVVAFVVAIMFDVLVVLTSDVVVVVVHVICC